METAAGIIVLVGAWAMLCGVMAAHSPERMEAIALMIFARAKARRAARAEFKRVKAVGICERGGTKVVGSVVTFGETRSVLGFEGAGMRAGAGAE